ncbi:SMI1/KNR4 family protein [Dyadobacter jiangsuensis]|uniref:SUKH superfamily protein n=1 Tax=Dyadobacter jiangsuensis TaxID=1591085 RepID=A0A2P8FPJ6_9BACT|nr:SMI1/KNR4 family protein [Dyadobacter jiangsuensis]PSL23627.1 SUKH superfamily protein [Dyadobacter jiangsuensis]
MEFLKKFDSIPSSRIDAFEEKHGFKLPTDYYEFLSTHNGGYPSLDKFEISDSQGADVLDVFHGLDVQSRFCNLDYLLDNYPDKFLKKMIPIAHDPGGNYICLNVNEGDSFGHVYFYDHEISNEGVDGGLTSDNLYLISRSFSEFLLKIY